ncbi:MAG: FIST C-terminal domain-containing protein, partial [Myxococcota bacterium]
RRVPSLDGQPAAAVLRDWVGPDIEGQVRGGGPILAQTALLPVGFGDPVNCVHPAFIDADTQAVDVFANLPVGTKIHGLSAERADLVAALDTVWEKALEDFGGEPSSLAGVFLIYCAGCAGAAGDELDQGIRNWAKGLNGVPMLGACTFGEQGHIPGHGNRHGNLSVGLMLMGREI